MLPFVLKWVVAALIVSVLVNLFSRLRRQGDHSHSSLLHCIWDLLTEWGQRILQQVPSSRSMLLSLIKLNGRGKAFKAMPSFIRCLTMLQLHALASFKVPLYSANVQFVACQSTAFLHGSEQPCAVHLCVLLLHAYVPTSLMLQPWHLCSIGMLMLMDA